MNVFTGDILEERAQIHFLLKMAAQRHPRLLAHDCHDALVVHLRIVKTVQEMDGTRTTGRQTDAHFTRKLAVCARHEGRHLLVPNLHVIHIFLGPADGTQDSVNSVAGKPVNTPDAPFVEAFD